jgi:hypothetical protein
MWIMSIGSSTPFRRSIWCTELTCDASRSPCHGCAQTRHQVTFQNCGAYTARAILVRFLSFRGELVPLMNIRPELRNQFSTRFYTALGTFPSRQYSKLYSSTGFVSSYVLCLRTVLLVCRNTRTMSTQIADRCQAYEAHTTLRMPAPHHDISKCV